MSSVVRNPLKAALRKQIKEVLLALSPENKKSQSDAITKKVRLPLKFNRFSSFENDVSSFHFRSLSLCLSLLIFRYWIRMHSNNRRVSVYI